MLQYSILTLYPGIRLNMAKRIKEQQRRLNEAHLQWMGDKMDQTDDILIMGISYT
jgi:hypothetical protein